VARFVGASNFIEATVARPGEDGALATGLGSEPLRAACPPDVGTGAAVTAAIRPENIGIFDIETGPPSGVPNVFRGLVEQTVFLGDTRDADIRVGSIKLLARHHPTLRLARGSEVYVALPPEHLAILPERVPPGPEAGDER
jgi:ABC-type Fe3+/spermidine/putrescine transport system ATPase subunit